MQICMYAVRKYDTNLRHNVGHRVVEVEIVRRRRDVSEDSAHVHDAVDGVDGIPT